MGHFLTAAVLKKAKYPHSCEYFKTIATATNAAGHISEMEYLQIVMFAVSNTPFTEWNLKISKRAFLQCRCLRKRHFTINKRQRLVLSRIFVLGLQTINSSQRKFKRGTSQPAVSGIMVW